MLFLLLKIEKKISSLLCFMYRIFNFLETKSPTLLFSSCCFLYEGKCPPEAGCCFLATVKNSLRIPHGSFFVSLHKKTISAKLSIILKHQQMTLCSAY